MKIPFTNFEVNFTNRNEGVDHRPMVYARPSSGLQTFGMDGYKLDYNALFTIYRNSADVFGCVREWQQNVGSAGTQFVDPHDTEAEVSPVLVKELLLIFNYWMPFPQLKRRIVRDLGVCDNAFVHITKNTAGTKVLGLQPIDPRTMSIVSDAYGTILKYIQRVRPESDPVNFDPEEILHFHLNNDPNHELFGISPMETIVWEARTDLSAMFSNLAFFRNDAQPAVQYVLDESLSLEEQKAAVAMINDSFKGAANRHKAAVMAGVKEVKVLSVSQKDMEFLEGRKFTTDKVCAAYGVPKFMLGYTETVNNNNGTELTRNFHEGTVKPIEESIEEVINQDFFARLGISEAVNFRFREKDFESQQSREERALNMLREGALSLRQFKMKLGMEITPEDEANPNFDAYIIHQGGAAVILEDVGAGALMPDDETSPVNSLVNQLERLKMPALQ